MTSKFSKRWIEPPWEYMSDAFQLIMAERQSQLAKWGTGGVENYVFPETKKLNILTEEYLEFVREILDGGSYEDKLAELVQVAAVCTAWIESMMKEKDVADAIGS